MDIGQLYSVLLSRVRLILGMALGAAVLALAYLLLVPANYTANTIVLLDPRQPRVTDSTEVLSGIGNDAAAVESQVELVRSPVLALKVIDELDLESDPDFNSRSFMDTIKESLGLGLTGPSQRDNLLVDRFESLLEVRRRGLTYILEISFSFPKPDMAAKIANAVAAAYIESQRELKADLTKDASQWLDEQISSIRKRVRKSEQAVADFKAKNDIVDVTQGNKLVEQRMADLSQQLAVAQAREAEIAARLKEVQAAAGGRNAAEALSDILKSNTMTGLRDQYANAARVEAQNRAIYGRQHPTLLASREQLGELRVQINQEVERVLGGLRTEQKAAKEQVAILDQELSSLKEQAEKLRQASVPLAELTREAEADRALLTQYLGRLKETSREESLQFENARVISPALAPLSPSRPRKIVVLLAAAIAGGLCGVALALFLEQQRRGLVSATEVEQVLGLPYLGTLPDLRKVRSPLNPISWFAGSRRRGEDAGAQAEYTRTVAAVARRLRRSAVKGSEILVVTSALPGEGKSTFAANLARALAASGVKTLLIDGDGYSGQITRMFGVNGPGLRELAEGQRKVSSIATSDVSSGLYVVGTGDVGGAQFHHLDERAICAVVKEFSEFFDTIVVDSPAILPTGGRMIECGDRLVMLAEWRRTDRADVIDALDMMGPQESNVAGVVLSKAPFEGRPSSSADRRYDPDIYLAGAAPLSLPREA